MWGAYGNVGAVAYFTIFSLLPEWLGGGKDPSPAIIAQANTAFFQIMGIMAVFVAFFCWFILKEPEGSFAEYHEGEEDDLGLSPVAVMENDGSFDSVSRG